MRILVICKSSRSIVCSARKAGYTACALDEFGDLDLLKCAEKTEILNTTSEKRIHELAESFGDIDAVILGPGFEKLKFSNVLNNRPEVMDEVNDKLKLAEKLRSMDIPHPEVASLDKASGLRFPLMTKPRCGSGGIRNVLIRNEDELADFKARSDADEFIVQEFVDGIPCSASLIGTGDEAVVVALNEQLIGTPWLTRMPFAYCGNITPFHTELGDEMRHHAERIALEFGLVGSNGVDFILRGKDLYVIEVNPRFQGSMDTVEMATGMNIFDSHVKSFSGELPNVKEPRCFAVKAIVYADRRVVVDEALSDKLMQCMEKGKAADIPQLGCTVQADEPITTLLDTAETHRIALEKIRKSARHIRLITEG